MPWVGDKYVVEVNLTESGIKQAIADIEVFQKDLEAKIDEFTEKMAEKGVEFAKIQILHYGAYMTGELYNSIDLKRGDVIPHGSCWIVYTDCPHAKYVEFGTGPVGAGKAPWVKGGRLQGMYPPHPSGTGKYRDTGWFWSNAYVTGLPSRPFMWDTEKYLELNSTIREVAKEVFG